MKTFSSVHSLPCLVYQVLFLIGCKYLFLFASAVSANNSSQLDSSLLLPKQDIIPSTARALIVDNIIKENTTVFMQVGTPRTGSTLMWYTVCSAVRLLHGKDVDCGMVDFGKPDFNKDKKKYYVGKTHDQNNGDAGKLRTALNDSSAEIAWFITQDSLHSPHYRVNSKDNVQPNQNSNPDVRDAWNKRAGTSRAVPGTLVATMELSNLIKYDISVIYDYQDIFQLSDSQTEMLYQHMRYWDILRKCCGYQQSVHNRDILHQRVDEYGEAFLYPNFPACSMYNISVVEDMFLHTELSKMFPEDLYLIHGGNKGMYITHGMCEREQQRIAQKPPNGWE